MAANNGVIVGGTGRKLGVLEAVTAEMERRGFLSVEIEGEICFEQSLADGYEFIAMDVQLPLAQAIAVCAAKQRQRRLHVVGARVYEQSSGFDCSVTHHVIESDGSLRDGPVAERIESAYDANWGDLCDGKPYYAVQAITRIAMEDIVGSEIGGATTSTHFTAPRSSGDAAIDQLADRVRMGVMAEISEVGGRRCLRVVNADRASSMSFLDTNDQFEGLVAHVGTLIKLRV